MNPTFAFSNMPLLMGTSMPGTLYTSIEWISRNFSSRQQLKLELQMITLKQTINHLVWSMAILWHFETTLKNWRNPESPRDNTWQSLGLILSCNRVLMVDPAVQWILFTYMNSSHSAIWDPEKKSLNFIFPTKYVIPKSLKFSHWLSEMNFIREQFSSGQIIIFRGSLGRIWVFRFWNNG